MSNPAESNTTPLTSFQQMVDILAAGEKPVQQWRIGSEHEKFGFIRPVVGREVENVFSPPAYRGNGIEAMLQGLLDAAPEMWSKILDKDALIGLKGQGVKKGQSISLEPAGQFELSGAPVGSLHETMAELEEHLDEVRRISRPLGLGFAPLGFHPAKKRDQMPWMPKSRYALMRDYMPKVGQLGLDMMTRTCTVQVNLDYSSEEDMARKMRVSLAFQPVATALFANSPFYEGKPNNRVSNRAHIWTDTDKQRSGMPLHFMEEGFGYEAYVNWALDVPMYFITRNGEMIDATGCSFRKWVEGDTSQSALKNFRPTIGDFEDHLTTMFPDVRLKQFLEMRGADAGTPAMMVAQSAFWVGLLYDDVILREAEKLACQASSWQVYAHLRAQVIEDGLHARLEGNPVLEIAKKLVMLSAEGLRTRNKVNAHGQDESIYLAPLYSIVHGGPTQAEYWLKRYHGAWQQDINRIFIEAEI